MGGGCRRPAPVPRASLVLGGAGNDAVGRRRTTNGLMTNGTNGSKHHQHLNGRNGDSNNNVAVNGKHRMVSDMVMEQQRTAMANSGRHRHPHRPLNVNGLAIHKVNDDPSADAEAAEKEENKRRRQQQHNGGKYSSDLVVVLDMDECLIHSQFLSDRDRYRQVEDRPATAAATTTSSTSSYGEDAESSMFLSACDSFRINLPDGDLVNVNKRPNLDLFLREITEKFETYIFTAAMEVYAAPVLDKLDPHGDMFRGRFYREHCVYDPDLGVYAKDLCDVLDHRKMMIDNAAAAASTNNGEDTSNGRNGSIVDALPCDERRVVLVDNNPLSFLPNPSNGILVSSFYDDPKDDTLEAVMELLHELDESDDVRPVLDDRFGLKDALDDVTRRGASPAGW